MAHMERRTSTILKNEPEIGSDSTDGSASSSSSSFAKVFSSHGPDATQMHLSSSTAAFMNCAELGCFIVDDVHLTKIDQAQPAVGEQHLCAAVDTPAQKRWCEKRRRQASTYPQQASTSAGSTGGCQAGTGSRVRMSVDRGMVPRTRLPGCGSLRISPSASARWPVSYTHLRAHETLMNL
eukprot:7377190-Prymnesium_polylepis.1